MTDERPESVWAWMTAIAFCLLVGLAVVRLSQWLGTW